MIVIQQRETQLLASNCGPLYLSAHFGSKQVYVAASEQKKGITVCLTVKASGNVLSMQLIYESRTDLSTAGAKPKHVKAWQPLAA
ncbi:hypothetical protein QJQ45_012488 [Haematococcus lacustris]|nr:hypothetical protein QJQ45_012488 [Haematococcus lacustris]